MGIYDRDYYRGETRNSGWLSGDSPVCKRLLIINIVVFILQTMSMNREGGLTRWLWLDPDSIFGRFEIWRLMTYAFCHDTQNPYHILFNMLGLWWFGRPLEAIYGARAFTKLYLGGAVVSGICHLAFAVAMDSNSPAIGASGAVMAIMAVTAMFFPHQVVYVMFVLPLELRWLVALFVVIDGIPVVESLTGHGSRGDGVAHAAHLGGLFYGFVFKKLNLQSTGFGSIPAFTYLRNLISRHRRGTGPVKIYRPPEPEEQPEDLEQRVDEILAKITEHGEASLTDAERQILKDASRRYKQR